MTCMMALRRKGDIDKALRTTIKDITKTDEIVTGGNLMTKIADGSWYI